MIENGKFPIEKPILNNRMTTAASYNNTSGIKNRKSSYFYDK